VVVSRCSRVPSAAIAKRSSLLRKTISVPSGDQDGDVSYAAAAVTCLSFAPSAAATQT
jgi:hypothetical protein